MSADKIIGLAWFDEAQWNRLTTVVPDRSELDDTFQDWEQSALEAVSMLESQGHTVKRVPIDVSALCTWCSARNLPVNGAARAEYVTALLRQGDAGV